MIGNLALGIDLAIGARAASGGGAIPSMYQQRNEFASVNSGSVSLPLTACPFVPKAIMVIGVMGSSTTFATDTLDNDLAGFVGITDGTNSYCTYWGAESAADDHARGFHNVFMRSFRADIVSTTVDFEASIVSFDQDEVVVNVTNATTRNIYLTLIAFGGDNIADIVVGTGTLPNTTTVTYSPGIRANALITFGNGQLLAAADANVATLLMGFGSYNGTTIKQCGQFLRYETPGGTANVGTFSNTTGVMAYANSVLNNITTTTFDITADSNLSSVGFAYMAIELVDQTKVWAGEVSVSADAAPVSELLDSGESFTPTGAIILASNQSALQATSPDNGTGSGFGLSVLTEAGGANWSEWVYEDRGGTSTGEQARALWSNANAVNLHNHTRTQVGLATFDSFGAGGPTLDFTVKSSAFAWLGLYLG